MRTILISICACACLCLVVAGCRDDDDPSSDTDTDTDSDTDGDTDTDTDSDVNEPTEKWVFVLPLDNDMQESSDEPVALGSDGTIYVVANASGNGGLLHAVNPDGELKWTNTDLPTPWSADCDYPVLSEGTGTIYVVCTDMVDSVSVATVYAISTSGTLKWSQEAPVEMGPAGRPALYTDGLTSTDHLLLSAISGTGLAGIYELDSNGNWGASFTLQDTWFHGLAIDANNNVVTRTGTGLVYKLDSNLGEIWNHSLSSLPVSGSLTAISVGHDGTIYVATSEPKLFAIAEDTFGVPYEKWTYTAGFYQMSEPVFGSDGTVYVYTAENDLVALDPATGSEIWSYFVGHDFYPAMTALEDGTILAGADSHYGHYDMNEEYVSWYVTSDGKYAPAVAADGSIYGMGQFENNISNALYAHQWNLAPSEIGWYRANGDNGNTRWAGSN